MKVAEVAPARASKPGRWIVGLVVVVAAVGIPIGVLQAPPRTVAAVGDSLTYQSLGPIGAFLGVYNDKLVPLTVPGSGILDTEIDWPTMAQQLIATSDPSVVIVEFIGDYGLLGPRPGVAPNSPAFFNQWAVAAQQLEDIFTSRGAQAYWVVGIPVAQPTGQATIDELDRIYANLHAPNTASGHPPLIDVSHALTGGTGRFTYTLKVRGTPYTARTPDGTHFTLFGAVVYGRAIAQGAR